MKPNIKDRSKTQKMMDNTLIKAIRNATPKAPANRPSAQIINKANAALKDRNAGSTADAYRVRKNITPYRTGVGPKYVPDAKPDQLRIRKNITPYNNSTNNPPYSGKPAANDKKPVSKNGSNPNNRDRPNSPPSRGRSTPTVTTTSSPVPKSKSKPVGKAPAKQRVYTTEGSPIPKVAPNTAPTPGPIKSAAPAAPVGPPVDPYEEFRRQASSIYQPQLNYLTGQENSNRNNAGVADRAVGGMYGKLERDIRSRVGAVNTNYNGAIQDVGANTDQAKTNINTNYDDARNKQAEVLKRLGIQEAAPQTMAQGTDDQAYYTSSQDRYGAAAKNLLTTQRAADTDFTQAQANISAQTGTDHRAGIQRSLQDILGQLSGKKADVQSNISSQTISLKNSNDERVAAQAQAQAENETASRKQESDFAIQKAKLALQASTSQREYDFNLLKLKATIDNNKTTLAANIRNNDGKLAATVENNRATLGLGQAKLGQQSKQFDRTALNTINTQNADRKLKAQIAAQERATALAPKPISDPWSQLGQLAGQLYPNTNAAGNAVKAIRDVVAKSGNRQYVNAAEFINVVRENNHQALGPGGDMPQLTQLATQIYKSIYG